MRIDFCVRCENELFSVSIFPSCVAPFLFVNSQCIPEVGDSSRACDTTSGLACTNTAGELGGPLIAFVVGRSGCFQWYLEARLPVSAKDKIEGEDSVGHTQAPWLPRGDQLFCSAGWDPLTPMTPVLPLGAAGPFWQDLPGSELGTPHHESIYFLSQYHGPQEGSHLPSVLLTGFHSWGTSRIFSCVFKRT